MKGLSTANIGRNGQGMVSLLVLALAIYFWCRSEVVEQISEQQVFLVGGMIGPLLLLLLVGTVEAPPLLLLLAGIVEGQPLLLLLVGMIGPLLYCCCWLDGRRTTMDVTGCLMTLVAERLNVRLIIVQVWRALVGSLSEVAFVCLSVTGLQLKCMGLHIVYVSCSTCFTLALVIEDSSEDRRRRQAREQMQRYRRRLSAQQRDERRQCETERRRLARKHQRDSLRSLTWHERSGTG